MFCELTSLILWFMVAFRLVTQRFLRKPYAHFGHPPRFNMAARALLLLLLLFGGVVSVGATDLLVSDRMVRVRKAESACPRFTPSPSGSESTQAVSGSDESVMSLRPGLFTDSESAIEVVDALLLLCFDLHRCNS